MLTCRDVVLLLSDHLDGTLAPDVATGLKSHLSGCPDCETFLQGFKAVTAATRPVLLKRAPADVAPRSAAAVGSRPAPH